MDSKTTSPSPDAAGKRPYDFVCVGFGVTALSLAIALQEEHPKARGLFLEKQPASLWSDTPTLPGSLMQTSFLHDLVQQRNPRSHYSVINFLHQTDQLLNFLNLSRMTLPRELMGKYLAWAASHFDEHVRYGEEALVVEPLSVVDGVVKSWRAMTRNTHTGEVATFETKRVITAMGAQPAHPSILPTASNPRFVHVSQFSDESMKALGGADQPLNIALVGCDQQAAEVFDHIQSSYPNARITWLFEDTAVRPKDDNPFVLELAQDPTSSMPPELHKHFLLRDRPDDAKTVSLGLIEHLYEQQVALETATPGTPAPPPKNQIVPLTELVACDLDASGRARLGVRHAHTRRTATLPAAFDLVVHASGLERTGCQRLLRALRPLVQDRSGPGVTANRESRVEFRRGVVAAAEGVGVWVVGGFEGGSDVNDEVFRFAARRSERLVQSIKTSLEDEQEAAQKGGNAEVSQARL